MTDCQFFTEAGVWRKPAGAERVDMILRGGDAGPSISGLGGEGEIVTHSFDADDLADEITVTGGGGDGSGYAVIISRKRGERVPAVAGTAAASGVGGGSGWSSNGTVTITSGTHY